MSAPVTKTPVPQTSSIAPTVRTSAYKDALSSRGRPDVARIGPASFPLPGEKVNSSQLIAFYLPQFYPIAENDAAWGKGFTEWAHVAAARPLFPSHYQPHIPADLGFYDLRLPETRLAQAALARRYGISAFCYYHYWMGGRRLLERPFNEVLESGEPDFPFCLCWANDSWTGIWYGKPEAVIVEQTYPGRDDHLRHMDWLARAFHDRRDLRLGGKPL